ncbi:PAS domain-containing sensor histidine kinase [Rhodopseudomonas palustris]|uniref:histidine kinase n=1 Tax=Rhodopseudomonas palustris TaxID=1076 RepID=A0A418V1N8_RHOPL|nr:ATP-binding protein [Rhodopseudomonas palustris]RJF69805.1 PAS domain S-box protein [Rhodopseudomonas palustris]
MTLSPDLRFNPPDVFNLTRESVVVRDPSGRILAWNRAAERLYGWSSEEAVGRVADDMLWSTPPLTRPAPGSNDVWTEQIVRVGRDRVTLLIDAQFTARRNADGALLDIVETSRSVSSERAALSREGEHRYRTLFHAMPTSYLELDITAIRPFIAQHRDRSIAEIRAHLLASPEIVQQIMRATKVVDANDHAVEVFGGGDREGMFDSVEPFWPPESREVYVDSMIARLQQVPRFTREVTMTTLSGCRIHCIFTACLDAKIVGDGRVIIGIVDVTALTVANRTLEEGRERYRALFHLMPIPLCRINTDVVAAILKTFSRAQRQDPEAVLSARPELMHHIANSSFVEEANVRAAKILGLEAPDDLRGLPAGSLLSSRPDTLRRLALASIRGVPFEEETQIVSPTGEELDVLLSMSFIEHAGSRFSLAGLIDIRDRLKAEGDLATLRADFAHAARISMLGELAASIAHEVNQPLAAIGASGEAGLRWLDRSPPNLDQVRTQLTRLVGQAERASRIIERIRTTAKSSIPERQTLDLSKVAQNAVSFLDHEARALRVSLDLRLSVDPCLVVADRTELEQVIANLVINAMQAIVSSEVRNGRVVVGVGATEHCAECYVIDNGPGLEPHVQKRLFESFFTTKREGMGLGLSVCRSIVQSLGGTMAGENRSDGVGARLSFRLPRAKAPPSTAC